MRRKKAEVMLKMERNPLQVLLKSCTLGRPSVELPAAHLRLPRLTVKNSLSKYLAPYQLDEQGHLHSEYIAINAVSQWIQVKMAGNLSSSLFGEQENFSFIRCNKSDPIPNRLTPFEGCLNINTDVGCLFSLVEKICLRYLFV